MTNSSSTTPAQKTAQARRRWERIKGDPEKHEAHLVWRRVTGVSPEVASLSHERNARYWARIKADPVRAAHVREQQRQYQHDNPRLHRENNQRQRQRRREYLTAYKLERGCVDCGFKAAPEALHFDHLDPSQKMGMISQMVTVSKERLAIEIAKCVIRCANCHAVRSKRQSDERLGKQPNG